MSNWKKLFTALRGGVNEATETVVDSQAIRILDQEIRDAKIELRKSEQAMTSVVAKRKIAQQKAADFAASIEEYERYAKEANASGNQSLALDCARRVSDIRDQREQEEAQATFFIDSEQKLKQHLYKAKENLRSLEQQVDVVKATASVQKAQEAVSSHRLGSNNRMKTATESLVRLQEKQKQRQAEIEAAYELGAEENDHDLEIKLREAGIKKGGGSAEDELARILKG
ncbi:MULTISPECIES: PspA/IM30 family protein [unclassified Halomonas]|uniref:PspA/IM30 family protein n=1 Tax=unclassified Halomonas TaxID=2609666 RepID=UPI001C960BF7|nr:MULTISPECIES: PspA/IM30 family protein [unclassified Halomonas]MBY5926139.1 PspA/IM30 family protein [Halomonas sp. DP4Y7-2]MBY6233181.1 PspA/IM30 family protein [Halomonas sp. DP4Y7-1]